MTGPHHLFEVYGIEIERMVVDAQTLAVKPVVDSILADFAQAAVGVEDVEDGAIAWSNELVAHVVEAKNNGPVAALEGVAAAFAASTKKMLDVAKRHGARFMPTGMHPWMDPRTETRIWPHASSVYYNEYHRIFDCHRHGWANLQSVHLNLPFEGEDEFGRLMAAVRIVLPLIPALAASTPIVEGRTNGRLDNRLDHYKTNAERTPSMAGDIIVEPIFEMERYEREVLAPITRELEEVGTLTSMIARDWTNARGAIARFERSAIEVRLIDAQECNHADVGVAALVAVAIQKLCEEQPSSTNTQRSARQSSLIAQLDRCVAEGPDARLSSTLVEVLGNRALRSAGDFWSMVTESWFDGPAEVEPYIDVIRRHGTLAQRILAATQTATGADPERAQLVKVYERLCDALESETSFVA